MFFMTKKTTNKQNRRTKKRPEFFLKYKAKTYLYTFTKKAKSTLNFCRDFMHKTTKLK